MMFTSISLVVIYSFLVHVVTSLLISLCFVIFHSFIGVRAYFPHVSLFLGCCLSMVGIHSLVFTVVVYIRHLFVYFLFTRLYSLIIFHSY